MTDGNTYAINRMLEDREAWDADEERQELLKAALDDADAAEDRAAGLQKKLNMAVVGLTLYRADQYIAQVADLIKELKGETE